MYSVIIAITTLLEKLDRLSARLFGLHIQRPIDDRYRRRTFWHHFPRRLPTDLPEYLAYMAEVEPEQRLMIVRLKNEHPQVTDISVEPWGAADSFSYGANFQFVIRFIEDSLPAEPISFPDQLTCTPTWFDHQGSYATAIGDFYLQYPRQKRGRKKQGNQVK